MTLIDAEESDGEDGPMEDEIRIKSHLHHPMVWESMFSFVLILAGFGIVLTLLWFAHHSWTKMPTLSEIEYSL